MRKQNVIYEDKNLTIAIHNPHKKVFCPRCGTEIKRGSRTKELCPSCQSTENLIFTPQWKSIERELC